MRVPRSGTLRNFYVRHNSPAASGGTITYTVFIEGVATSISVTMQANVSDGDDLVNTAPITQGSRIRIVVTKPVILSAAPLNITATLLIGP